MNSERRRLALFLAITAWTVAAAAADRVVVRGGSGTAIITGVDAGIVSTSTPGATITRSPSDAQLIEVTGPPGRELRLSVPRGATVELAAEGKTGGHISDVAAVRARTVSGNLTAERIGGSVVVTTGNGNVTLDGVRGLIEVTTGNGNVNISNVGGGVHVVSINGKTDIRCVAGSVRVKDTSGAVSAAAVRGDVDLFTALGRATYRGLLQRDHSYRLETLDGAVSLEYDPAGAGFTARLASDARQIELDRALAAGHSAKEARLDVRAGDEGARIVLDAVGGRVALVRLLARIAPCPR